MLTELRIGNFKAFGETQRIPIKPLTLIFGANSAGKSSIIHSLLLARHAADTGDLDTFKTEVGGDSVDLGGFRQYIHKHEADRCAELTVGLDASAIAIGVTPLVSDGPYYVRARWRVAGMMDDYDLDGLHGLPRGETGVIEIESLAGKTPIWHLARKGTDSFALEKLHPEFTARLETEVIQRMAARGISGGESQSLIKAAIANVWSEVAFTTANFLPIRLAERSRSLLLQTPLPTDPLSADGERIRLAAVGVALQILEEIVCDLNRSVTKELGRLCYLGPLRSYPPRHLLLPEARDRNWFAGGGYAWEALARDDRLRARINEWLSSDRLQTRYKLGRRRFVNPREASALIKAKLDEILGDLEFAEHFTVNSDSREGNPRIEFSREEADTDEWTKSLVQRLLDDPHLNCLEEVVLMDEMTKTAVYHRDVGIGVSQVLPVLVHAFADSGKIVAIEQPEIHLHPALQAELGDVFIESALGERKNTFLLETHSEHLILRIMRRIRETPIGKLPVGMPHITSQDVAVLFVEPTPQGSVVREMRLDERGRLVDPWPGGFFEESFNELF